MDHTKLPVDIWWKIITMILNPEYKNYDKNNPMESKALCKYIDSVGKHITSDLFIFRRLCKTTKHVVEKYTKRYKSDLFHGYMIVFRYGNSNPSKNGKNGK